MKTNNVIKSFLSGSMIALLVTLYSCGNDDAGTPSEPSVEGLMFALLRDTDAGASDQSHPYAVMDFNPYSSTFGEISNSKNGQLGHHGYVSPINGGLYVTLADDLGARVHIQYENGKPVVHHLNAPLDDDGMRVGEDIFWFKENGQDRYAITSLAGDDAASNGGGIVIYDANTDQVVRVINDGHKYTHGISMLDNTTTALVTEVIHESIATSGIAGVSVENIGREAKLVDLTTGDLIETYDLGALENAGDLTGLGVSPVECLILRGSINSAFNGNEKALVMNMLKGDIVVADWDETAGTFGDFTSKFAPSASDTWGYFGLEFYATNASDESDGVAKLYVTYAEKVITFDLEALANTGELVRTSLEFDTKSCAHHLAFFDATDPATGQKVPLLLVQQNLLNLGPQATGTHKTEFPFDLAGHEVSVFNRSTGEMLKTINIYDTHGYGVEYIGGLDEDAYPHHH